MFLFHIPEKRQKYSRIFIKYSLIFSKYSCVFLLFYVFYAFLNKNISHKGFNIKYQNRVSYSVLKLE